MRSCDHNYVHASNRGLPTMTTALPAPRPLDALELSSDLDGRYGTNRANGRMQVAADTDLDALRAWLARFADTKTTFDNYRKEAERLLLWSVVQMGKPLSSLTHEDLLVYQHFLADPQPAARWTADGGRKHPRNDPRWRPFYGPLSVTSQRQAMVILNVMFAWLVQAGYLAGNPLSLSRQRARRAKPRITRYLSPELWLEVKTYVQCMPVQTAREREHHARVRWLFTLLYLGGLRITEVGTNTMGQFFRRADENGTDRWWLEVMGKGGKERLVPATAEMMTELLQHCLQTVVRVVQVVLRVDRCEIIQYTEGHLSRSFLNAPASCLSIPPLHRSGPE